MNCLWVFGDSFSEDNKDLPKDTERIIYSKVFLKKDYHKIWAEILSEKLNLEYRNYSATKSIARSYIQSGNTNDDCLNSVSYFSNQFQKGDIVFVGLTDTSRFKIPSISKDGIVNSILPNIIQNDLYINRFIKTKELYKICALRGDRVEYYVEEFMIRMIPILELSKKVGFKIYFWSWVSEINKTIFDNNFDGKENWIFFKFNDFIKNNFSYNSFLKSYLIDVTIFEETKGMIRDYHQSEKAHIIHSDLLFEYIIKQNI